MLDLQKEDQHELTRFCTGEFIKRRAMSVITGARCYELHKSRKEGRTGTQTNLNQISSEMAQVSHSKIQTPSLCIRPSSVGNAG